MRYTSLTRGGKTTDRTVDPYRLDNQHGDWYLAAFDHRRGRVLDFALHRIRSLNVHRRRLRAAHRLTAPQGRRRPARRGSPVSAVRRPRPH